MKKLWNIALIFIAISFTNCEEETINNQSIKGTWKVASFDNHLTGEIITQTEENAFYIGQIRDITLHFNEDTLPFQINGMNTTNEVSTKYTYLDNNEIIHKTFFTTEAGQPLWGDYFSAAANAGLNVYELDGSTLRIYHSYSTKSVVFMKE
jgi:uncharacterized protein YbcV (DUF1398 family)